MKKCCQIVATEGVNLSKSQQKASKIKLFRASEIIPTRRVKSISKLFCIEDLIRRGFI